MAHLPPGSRPLRHQAVEVANDGRQRSLKQRRCPRRTAQQDFHRQCPWLSVTSICGVDLGGRRIITKWRSWLIPVVPNSRGDDQGETENRHHRPQHYQEIWALVRHLAEPASDFSGVRPSRFLATPHQN